MWCLLFDLFGVIKDTFDRIHIVFDLSQLANEPAKGLVFIVDGKCVDERQSSRGETEVDVPLALGGYKRG